MSTRSVIETVIRLLPAKDQNQLGAELSGHLADAEQAGDSPSAVDALSVTALVGRRWANVGFAFLPYILLGLPMAFLAFFPFMLVYETHFPAWDFMEDVPSTTPLAIALRSWVVGATVAVLCLVAGGRAVMRIRSGSYLLPAALGIAALIMMTQSELFTERLPWYSSGRLDLKPAHADFVSPYSVYMLALAVLVPLGFLVIDALLNRRSRLGIASDPQVAGRVGAVGVGIAVIVAAWLARPVVFIVPALMVVASGRLSRRAIAAVVLCLVVFCVWIGVVAVLDD